MKDRKLVIAGILLLILFMFVFSLAHAGSIYGRVDGQIKMQNDLFAGITTADGVTVSGDTLTFANAGIYFFNYSLSFSGNNGETWKIRTLVNDTDAYGGTTRYTSNNDTGNVSAGCIIDVSADDYLIMQIMNQTDNDDPTVKSGQIKTFRIK